jgi:O-antigen/teichoic acid export membrane protein
MKAVASVYTRVKLRALAIGSSPIKRVAIAGTLWTVGGFGAGQALRMISSLILTRLLFPELFGLMSLVWTVMTGLQLFSDVGLDANITRHPKGEDPEFLGTAWTIQIVRGALLFLCCGAAGFPLAKLYNEPRLLWLLPLVGSTLLIGGFNSPAIYVLRRRLDIWPLIRLDLVGQIVGLIVTGGWAYISPTAVSLATGALATAFVQLALSYRLDRSIRPRRAYDRLAGAEIFHFGKWIFITTITTFIASQGDRLIVGKLFSLTLLGTYGIAITLAEIPRALTSSISTRVIFPAFSRLIDADSTSFREKILKNRRHVLLGGAVGLAFFVSLGDIIVRVLYDSRYEAAAWMVPVLAIGSWPIILALTIDPALYALGRPQGIALANVLSFTVMVAAIFLGAKWFGIAGVIAGISLSRIPFHLAILAALRREGISCVRQDMLYTSLFGVCTLSILATRLALGIPIMVASN